MKQDKTLQCFVNRIHRSEQTAFCSNPKGNSIYRHHQMVNTEIRLIIFFCSWRWRSSIQSTKTRPGADCGSDHQLLIAKSRLKFKKVGKITRQFRCDLSKIPYDYTVEVMNRLKGLDLPEEQWIEVHNIVQETVTKTNQKKNKSKEAKWVSEAALQIAEERGHVKSKWER